MPAPGATPGCAAIKIEKKLSRRGRFVLLVKAGVALENPGEGILVREASAPHHAVNQLADLLHDSVGVLLLDPRKR